MNTNDEVTVIGTIEITRSTRADLDARYGAQIKLPGIDEARDFGPTIASVIRLVRLHLTATEEADVQNRNKAKRLIEECGLDSEMVATLAETGTVTLTAEELAHLADLKIS